MRLIILALCIAAAAGAPSTSQRIVGGSTAIVSNYPMIAALLYSADLVTYRQACGGSILNHRSILTAAHCTSGHAAVRWNSRVGSSFANTRGDIYSTYNIINHPQYNRITFDNDIAIVRVAGEIWFNVETQPGAIALRNHVILDSDPLWAAGWGAAVAGGPNNDQLRQVQVWPVDQATCRNLYANVGLTVTNNMLCASLLTTGGSAQCEGDDGGPVLHFGAIVGVYSFGRGCEEPRLPGVNTRVSNYHDWIVRNM